jgi:undecaprenyl pyrophosphate phosphatase UppP
MKSLKVKIAALSIIPVISLLLIAPMNFANGQVGDIPGVQRVGPTTVGGLVDVLRNVVRWVYIIFFVLAVMFILFAAFNYLTAGGEAEKISKAKNQLIYAIIAIVVALLAVGFETIIRNFLASPGA